MWLNNILETIGNTPLIRLNKITRDLPCTVLAKVDYFNPGNSIKDRMAIKMIEVAEKDGHLKPGGTIIECTSGNTGMGLAIAACVKGYKCIFTTTDKQSKEKADILKALGAEVIVCPTNVEPADPRSYYSVARRLAKEIPNSYFCNQYDNVANRRAHYETTGPEIWRQTDGKVDAFVCSVGTGGTLAGVSLALKERNPTVKAYLADPLGSAIYSHYARGVLKAEGSSITEGIGQGRITKNLEGIELDGQFRVTDEEMLPVIYDLLLHEGLVLGGSTGINVCGA